MAFEKILRTLVMWQSKKQVKHQSFIRNEHTNDGLLSVSGIENKD